MTSPSAFSGLELTWVKILYYIFDMFSYQKLLVYQVPSSWITITFMVLVIQPLSSQSAYNWTLENQGNVVKLSFKKL